MLLKQPSHALMTTCIDIDRCNLIPFSLSSLYACQARRPSSSSWSASPKTLIITRSASFSLGTRLCFDKRFRGVIRIPRCISGNQHREVPNRLDERKIKEEVDKGSSFEVKEDSALERQQTEDQLKKRIFSGLGIGISCGGVVLAGGWVFTCAIAAAVFVGSREYFELVRSRGIAEGMTPPPRYLSRVCSFICMLMPILTLCRLS